MHRQAILICATCASIAVQLSCTQAPTGKPTTPPSLSTNTLSVETPGKSKNPIGKFYPEYKHNDIHHANIRQGISHFNNNELNKAQKVFVNVLSTTPNQSEALYYLALIEAKNKNLASARDMYTRILRQDLPQFTHLLLHANETRVLRNSVILQDLIGATTALKKHWLKAVEQGIPVVYWKVREQSDDPYAIKAPSQLRAGIYLPDTSRFIPLGIKTPNAIAVHFLPQRSEVAVIFAERYPGLNSSFTNVLANAYHATSGEKLGATYAPPRAYIGPELIELAGGEQGLYIRVKNNPLSNPNTPPTSQWQALTGGSTPRTMGIFQSISAEGSILAANKHQGLLTANEPGKNEFKEQKISIKYNDIKIELTNLFSCVSTDKFTYEPKLTHNVSYLDKKNLRKNISKGEGGVSVRVDGNNRLLLQINRKVYFFDSKLLPLSQAKSLPDGLLLTTPLDKKYCIDL